MRIFIVARHAESVLNYERRVNGDPAVAVDLTEHGREQARILGRQLANVPLDVCVHTRFPRARQTAEIAVAGRGVPLVEEPLLDDIDVGELEGETISRYREWKRGHGRSDPFPGGESLDDAARRYARAYRHLVEGPHERALVICHEIPLRYALNAVSASDELDGPVHDIENAEPYVFDEAALARAAAGIEHLAPAP